MAAVLHQQDEDLTSTAFDEMVGASPPLYTSDLHLNNNKPLDTTETHNVPMGGG